MSELIAIREAARRLGVSDTAVRKAITAGRIKVAGHHEGNGRPLLAWPQAEADWHANSDASKRTHVGSQGSPRRPRDEAPPPPTASAPQTPATTDDGNELVIHDGMTLNEAKTAREIYAARQAKLDYEESVGKLINAGEVKLRAFKLAKSARDTLMTMPDRLAPILASSTDVQEVHRLLLEDIERTCLRLSDAALAAA